ncbi:MAG: hypothetical protein AAB696_01035 [Patescibacteria group bacterium]
MSTQTAEKIYREVKALKEETKTLKELVFLILKDPEGEYKKSFIKKIVQKYQNKPQFVFTNKKYFLKQIS